MFCPNCGMQNVDNALFCKNCGKSLKEAEKTEVVNECNVEQTEQQELQQNQQYQNYYQPYQKPEKVYSPNPVVNAIKKTAASGTLLTANILYTIATALMPLSLFVIAMILWAQAIMLEGFYGIEVLIAMIFIFGFIAMIPNIITLIGMWQIYGAGRNTKQPGMSVAGFTTSKIVTIIKMVFRTIVYGGATLIYLIGTIVMFVFSVSLDEYAGEITEYSGAQAEILEALLPTIYLIVTVIFAIIFIVDLILRIKTLSTIDTVKNSAVRGRKTGKISMYLIVMLFISGGFSCISGLISLLQLNLYPLIMGVSYILYAVSLLNLREEFNKIKESPEQ